MVAITFGDQRGGDPTRLLVEPASLSATFQTVETASPMTGWLATLSVGKLFLRSFNTIQAPPAFLCDRDQPRLGCGECMNRVGSIYDYVVKVL